MDEWEKQTNDAKIQRECFACPFAVGTVESSLLNKKEHLMTHRNVLDLHHPWEMTEEG